MIKINNNIVDIKKFPDGTQRFELSEKIKNTLIDYDNNIISIHWKYETDEELFSICCLKDLLDSYFKNKQTILYLHYIPNARQDRIKNQFEVFTLKTFCKIINSCKFDSIEVLDAHSNVSLALLNSCINRNPKAYVNQVLNKEQIDLIFYPDEGSSKRYSDLFEMPYIFGIKKRDWQTGKIQGLDIVTNNIDFKGKNILIMDDICSYGGTIYHSAKKLKEMGANKIYVFITHCENSILDGDLIKSNLVEKFYTTDSLITKKHPLIEII